MNPDNGPDTVVEIQCFENRSSSSSIRTTLTRAPQPAAVGLNDELLGAMYSAFAGESHGIGLDLEFDSIVLGPERAVPCALILNELLSNAFKYAFVGGRSGQILVSFRQPDQDAASWPSRTMALACLSALSAPKASRSAFASSASSRTNSTDRWNSSPASVPASCFDFPLPPVLTNLARTRACGPCAYASIPEVRQYPRSRFRFAANQSSDHLNPVCFTIRYIESAIGKTDAVGT